MTVSLSNRDLEISFYIKPSSDSVHRTLKKIHDDTWYICQVLKIRKGRAQISKLSNQPDNDRVSDTIFSSYEKLWVSSKLLKVYTEFDPLVIYKSKSRTFAKELFRSDSLLYNAGVNVLKFTKNWVKIEGDISQTKMGKVGDKPLPIVGWVRRRVICWVPWTNCCQ